MKRPVVYVEDEEDDVIMMEIAWKRAAIDLPLVSLSDGEQALDYIDNANDGLVPERHLMPCLVLLDLNLPRKSGLELLKQLREKFDKAQLPIVIFSSSDSPKDKSAAINAGANGYIVKPSGMQQLTEVVASLPSILEQPVTRSLN